MPQEKSILKKFYSELANEEKLLLETYIDDPDFDVLSETFDNLVSDNEKKHEDKKDKD